MKIKNIILGIVYVFFLFVTINGAFASLLTDNINYYSFDEDDVSGQLLIDLANYGNGTCQNMGGDCNTIVGKLINASGFAAASSNYIDGADFDWSDDFTFNIWLYSSSPNGTNDWAHVFTTGGASNRIDLQISGVGGIYNRQMRFYSFTSAPQVEVLGNNPVPIDEWFMITVTHNDTSSLTKMYINSVQQTNTSSNGMTDLGFAMDFGRRVDNLEYFDGRIDEWGFWNRTLTQSEVTELYNGDNAKNPYSAVNISSFKITAKSFWNSASISIFNATINGTTYNTTNGTIITPFNTTQKIELNITVESDGWFSEEYLNYNISNNLNAVLKQTDITFNFRYNNGELANISPINVEDLTDLNSFNTSTGILNIFPDAKNVTFEISCNNNIFQPFNQTFEFTELQNETINVSVNETLNQLTFLDINDSSPIVGANITVNYPSGQTLLVVTNSTGQIPFSWIYNNVTEFGVYNFTISKLGYISQNFTETINASNIPFSKTYNISRAKLIINIFDRSTNTLLTGVNVSVALIGVFNETTNNGTLTKDNLSIIANNYTLFAGSDGYKTEIRAFEFSNQESLTVNFYLLNLTESNTGTLFVSTLDSFFRIQTGANVELLEYNPDELSFISVAECITNINGECSFSIELNTKIYYLRATAIIEGSLFVAESNPEGEIITTNNELRQLIFFTRTDFVVDSINNLAYDIDETFVNNVSSISVDFFTIDGTALEVCIEYFIRNGTNYISVTGDTYCLVSSSAVQNIGSSVTLNRSNNYEARVYIKESSGNRNLQVFSYPSSTSTDSLFNDDFKATIIMIIWILLLAIALQSKNINLFLWGGIILSWGEVIVFPTFIVLSISVLKTVILSITLYVTRRRRDIV